MATSYLTRAAQTASSNTTMTISLWFKRSKIGSGTIWMHENQASHNAKLLLFFSGTNDQISMQSYNGSAEYVLTPTRKFRDLSSWYHVTAVWNTTVATTADRMQIWVNGVRETSFSTANYPSRNHEIDLSNKAHQIGRYGSSGGYSNYWDGLMSQFILVDGQAYNASKFGLVDSDTGEWKANASPTGITYGNRGVWLKMENSSNLGLDSSGKNNNYTSSGVVRTPSCPNNVFCTMNPLARYGSNLNYSNANNTTTGSTNNWSMGSSTLGASTGKYYYEYKLITAGTGSGYFKVGFISGDASSNSATHIANASLDGGYAFYCSDGGLEVRTDDAIISGYSKSDLGVSFSMNDIMCLAVDMDNKKVYFRKNGDAWIKSANPVNGTYGLDISSDYTVGKAMIPAVGIYYPGVGSLNFGNGYFGTTAVSSAGTNASGNGIFEYDVPTGYTALSTKGLNL